MFDDDAWTLIYYTGTRTISPLLASSIRACSVSHSWPSTPHCVPCVTCRQA